MSILSVSEITSYIKQSFEADPLLVSLFVRGEISNFKHHFSGHCYFTLKDATATIKAVMFKGSARFLRFEPQNGMKVLAGGHITVFERDGQYQLYVSQLSLDGLGELSLAYARLKEKLTAEGLFATERKRPLPFLPRRLGIITSRSGAALHDIITVTKRRHPNLPLLLYPVQVQGPEAPAQIVQAIRTLNKLNLADVLIVGRGGGSIEELWAFNDEKVVRAIAASLLPVVSAVGHETDFTLADFAADRRAATPSQAAEIVVPDLREVERQLLSMRTALQKNLSHLLSGRRLQYERLRNSAALNRPRDVLNVQRQLWRQSTQLLQQKAAAKMNDNRQKMQLLAEKLALLNPWAVLGRGYSIVRTADKRVIVDSKEVEVGKSIEIIPRQGRIIARVESVIEGGTADGTHSEK